MDFFDELKNLEKQAMDAGDKSSPQEVPVPTTGLDCFDDLKGLQKEAAESGDKVSPMKHQHETPLNKEEEKLLHHFQEKEDELLGLIDTSSKLESTFTRETKNDFEETSKHTVRSSQETMDLSFGTTGVDKFLEESSSKMEEHRETTEKVAHKGESSFKSMEAGFLGNKPEPAGGDTTHSLQTQFEEPKGFLADRASPNMMEFTFSQGIDQVSPPDSPYHRMNVTQDITTSLTGDLRKGQPTVLPCPPQQPFTSEIMFDRESPTMTGHGIDEELPPENIYSLMTSFTGSTEEFSKGVSSTTTKQNESQGLSFSAGTDFENLIEDSSLMGIGGSTKMVESEKTELLLGNPPSSSLDENFLKESQDEPYNFDRVSPNMMDLDSKEVESVPMKVENLADQYASNFDFLRDVEPVVPVCPPQPPITVERFDLDHVEPIVPACPPEPQMTSEGFDTHHFERETPSPNQMDYGKGSEILFEPSAPYFDEKPFSSSSFASTEIKPHEAKLEEKVPAPLFQEEMFTVPTKLSEPVHEEPIKSFSESPVSLHEKHSYLEEDILAAPAKSPAPKSNEKETKKQDSPKEKFHDSELDTFLFKKDSFESTPASYKLATKAEEKNIEQKKPEPVKPVPVVNTKPAAVKQTKQPKALSDEFEVSEEVQKMLNIFNPCKFF